MDPGWTLDGPWIDAFTIVSSLDDAMNNVMNIDGLLLSYIQIVGRHNGARSGSNERPLWICDRGGCEVGRGYNCVVLCGQQDSVTAVSASISLSACILPDLHQ